MTKPVETITVGGRTFSRFIRHPKAVRDGTVRCISCGQIDEPQYHTLTCEEAIKRQGASAPGPYVTLDQTILRNLERGRATAWSMGASASPKDPIKRRLRSLKRRGLVECHGASWSLAQGQST